MNNIVEKNEFSDFPKFSGYSLLVRLAHL